MLDDNGKQIYSLKINSVKIANDFEYKSDFPKLNRKQIVEVRHTFINYPVFVAFKEYKS